MNKLLIFKKKIKDKRESYISEIQQKYISNINKLINFIIDVLSNKDINEENVKQILNNVLLNEEDGTITCTHELYEKASSNNIILRLDKYIQINNLKCIKAFILLFDKSYRNHLYKIKKKTIHIVGIIPIFTYIYIIYH